MEGFIKKRILVDAGYNSAGEVIAQPSISYGDAIECDYEMNKSSVKGVYSDGEFNKVTYTILIEDMAFDASVLLLLDSSSNKVLEKEVLSIERLESVQKVKIYI